METLLDYVRTHEPHGFKPKPHYSTDGDSLVFYFKDEESYGERVDNFLTVYRSIETDSLVGCQIKGLPAALKLLGDFGLFIEERSKDKAVRLGMIFMACMAATPSPEPQTKERYVELGKISKEATIPARELRSALELVN
jgi:hypothetical protein